MAYMLDPPPAVTGLGWPMAGGQVLAGVITAAIPVPPPRRAIVVVFARVDG
jgi:hypothetical protein